MYDGAVTRMSTRRGITRLNTKRLTFPQIPTPLYKLVNKR